MEPNKDKAYLLQLLRRPCYKPDTISNFKDGRDAKKMESTALTGLLYESQFSERKGMLPWHVDGHIWVHQPLRILNPRFH